MKSPFAVFPRWIAIFCGAAMVASADAADKETLEFPPPKSPEQSLAAMQAHLGLQIEIVAAEPLVIDPVAIDWGADGKLWVVEMRDYPMGMDGNWKPGSRIKFLEDTNGDGKYDKAIVFLDDLPFATGVTAWRTGALICTAPDILYAEDSNGDGRADVVKKLFTGFDTGNYQARVNSLSLGLDNWVYGANGLRGGTIRGEARAIRKDPKSKVELASSEVDIRGRDFRMHPDTGEFEPASGLTQQGRARDDWNNWFGCDNSTAAWHYPIPDHYLCRNPHVAAPSPRAAIAAGVDGNLLHPISYALERFNNPASVNRVTSGCGIGVYRDVLLGQEFYGNAFVCEPVHNLVHRMVLQPNGVTFSAVRAKDEQRSEFLSSRDNWFRPVQMRTGPDGAVWVVDMYRFVIEHPRWIPPERLAKLDPRAGDDKGRIYRVFPKGVALRPIRNLTKLSSGKLAAMLDTPNGTERDRIHQQLVFGERTGITIQNPPDKQTVAALGKLGQKSQWAAVRLQALCVLEGLGALKPELVMQALSDSHAAVRANAIRLSEGFLRHASAASGAWRPGALLKLVDDPELTVRFQLALSLGEWDDSRAGEALARLTRRDVGDDSMRAAILSSAIGKSGEILKALFAADPSKPDHAEMISQLIATAAGEGGVESLRDIVKTIAPDDESHLEIWRLGALDSLLDVLERKHLSLLSVSGRQEEVVTRLNLLFDWASTLAADWTAKSATREAAIRLLGRRADHEKADLDLLVRLLDPTVPGQLQKAALATLKANRSGEVGKLILSNWNRLPFALRSVAIEVLLSREEWTRQLLAALESGAVGRNEIPLANRQLLLKNSVEKIRESAEKLLQSSSSDRAEVIKKYQGALALTGDALKGRTVWANNCVVCHYFRGEGAGVGPNLGALTDKTPADFLTAILDPNAAVEPRFVAYNVETKDGRSLTGVVSAETATTLTLAQGGGTYEKILRSDLVDVRPSGVSLMPEGLEQSILPQDLANLIAYLNSAPHPVGSATDEQAEAARKKFLELANGESVRIIEPNERTAHASWMGELPLATCLQISQQTRIRWEMAGTRARASDSISEFHLPVAMGHKGSAGGKFSLRFNGKPVLEFGVALHDQSWQSADGQVRISYFTLEDNVRESNGILTIAVSGSLLEPGKAATLEVLGSNPNSQSWFGLYCLEPTKDHGGH